MYIGGLGGSFLAARLGEGALMGQRFTWIFGCGTTCLGLLFVRSTDYFLNCNLG